MDLSDVVAVLQHITQAAPVVEQYTVLQQSLTQLAQRPQGAAQLKTQVQTARDAILRAQKALEPPPDWNEPRHRAFREFGARDVLGQESANALDNVLSTNVADPVAAGQGVQRLQAQIQSVVQRATQTLGSLGALARKQTYSPVDGVGAVVLAFQGGVSIDRLSDLQEWTKEWDWAFKTFSRLTHQPSESPHVVDVQQGSLLIVLGTSLLCLRAIAKTADIIAGAVEKAMRARKIAAEARALELHNLGASVPGELETAADGQVDAAVKNAVVVLVDANNWPAGQDRNELESHLREALNTMSKFMTQGGRIDFRLPSTSKGQEAELKDAQDLRTKVVETSERAGRLMDELNHLRQLPAKKDPPGDPR